MGAEWTTCTLADVAAATASAFVDGPFGSALPASDYTPTGVPVIRGSNLTLGSSRFVDEGYVFVSESTAERLHRALCRPGDIVFTKKGTIGQTGIVPSGSRFTRFLLSSNQMKLTVDPSRADPLFVYYAVSCPGSREKIIRDASVTGVPKINLGYIRQFPIPLPALPVQRAIAHILGTLDDKIELNRQTNETLEAMARALFKSWFVDFDPVRAKAEGRQPSGMDAETAKLFPSEFVESELGEIPNGWIETTVGDLLSLEYGKALKESERQPGHVLVFGSNGIVGRHSDALVRGSGIVVGRKGNPGIVTWAPSDFFVIDTAFYVVPKYATTSLRFLRHLLEALNLARLSADSAVPGVNRNAIYAQVVVRPSVDVLERFHDLTEMWGQTVASLGKQSATLAHIRDELLPRLLSGELPVSSAENVLEAQA